MPYLRSTEVPTEFEYVRKSASIPWERLLSATTELEKAGKHPFTAFTDAAISLAKNERKKKKPTPDIIQLGLEACIARGLFEMGLALAEGFDDFRSLCLKAIASFTITGASKIEDILEKLEASATDTLSLHDQIRILSVRILHGVSKKDENVLATIIEFDALLDSHPDLISHPLPETVFTIYVIGILLSEVGQYEHARKAASVLEDIGRKTRRQTALILFENLMGHIANRTGEFNEAEAHYKRVLNLSQEIGHKLGLGIALNNLGSLMLNSIRLEEALEYLTQAETMFESDAHKVYTLANLGEITALLGRHEQSMEYMQQALALQDKVGKKVIELHTWMVILHSKVGEFKEARKHLRMAKKIVDTSGTAKDKSAYFHAKGVLAFSENNYPVAIRSLSKALKVAKESNLLEWIIRPLLDIVRTYLSSYNVSHKDEDVSNALYHLENLIQFAKEQRLDSLHAEGLLLRSELHAHAGSIEDALADLDKVEGVAVLTENARLSSIVRRRRAELSGQDGLQRSLVYSEIDESLDRVSGFHPVRDIEEIPQPELHALIALNRESGLPEFVYHFDTSLKIDSSILSGFISAITSFAGEMMGTGLIRSINQEGFTLMLEHTEKRIVLLVTTVETFDIRYRLHEFAHQFDETFPLSNDAIVPRKYAAADEMVESIFC